MRYIKRSLMLCLLVVIWNNCSEYSIKNDNYINSLRRVKSGLAVQKTSEFVLGETTRLYSPVFEEVQKEYKLWSKSHPGVSWAQYYRDNVVAIKGRGGKITSSRVLEKVKDAQNVAKAIDLLIAGKKNWGRGMSANDKFKAIEEICRQTGIKDEYQKLLVYRALEPGFRDWWWEELAAKLPKGSPQVAEKVNEFFAKVNHDYLNSTKTTDVIAGLWELRWVYFNKNLDNSLRSKALNTLFGFLNRDFSSPAANQLLDTNAVWKNAKEVLAEIMEAVKWTKLKGYTTDSDIWGLAFEKSAQALDSQDQFWSWRAITEAWRTLDFDKSLELVSLLDLNNPMIARFVIGDILMYPKLIKDTHQRDNMINQVFDKFRDKDGTEWGVYGEALLRIRSPKIAQRLIDEVINQDGQSIEKKVWAVKILGNLHYEDAGQIEKVREELIGQAFSTEPEVSIEAANALLDLRSRAQILNVLKVEDKASSDDIKLFKEFVKSIIPEGGAALDRFLGELSYLGINSGSTAPNAVQVNRLLNYLDQSDSSEVLGNFFKALMAAKGPREVISEYFKTIYDSGQGSEETAISNSIASLERVTGEPFEMLLTYMITKRQGSYQPIPFNLDVTFSDGQFKTPDGTVYTRKGYWDEMKVNPVEAYETTSNPDDIILVKGGSEYTVLSEYLTMKFFSEYIKNYLGEDSGIAVPSCKLIYDGGQLKLAVKHFQGYEKGTRYLQPQYWNDERMQALIAPTLLLKTWERTPENMLFRRKNWDVTSDKLSNMPDVIWTNFEASLFSKATGGFSEFDPWFDKFRELDMLTATSYYGENDSVNRAFYQMRMGGDMSKLKTYVRSLFSVFPDAKIRDIINEVFDEVVGLTGKEYGTVDTIEGWISQVKAERQLGNWNRKKPFLMNLSLETLERALKYGLRGYLYEVIKQRKYNIPETFP